MYLIYHILLQPIRSRLSEYTKFFFLGLIFRNELVGLAAIIE